MDQDEAYEEMLYDETTGTTRFERVRAALEMMNANPKLKHSFEKMMKPQCFRQDDSVERQCVICERVIKKHEWLVEFDYRRGCFFVSAHFACMLDLSRRWLAEKARKTGLAPMDATPLDPELPFASD
jgi:hypothetical protein